MESFRWPKSEVVDLNEGCIPAIFVQTSALVLALP